MSRHESNRCLKLVSERHRLSACRLAQQTPLTTGVPRHEQGDEIMAEVHEMPDRESGDRLTTRQRRVLEVIRNSVDRRGYPPSLREIGEAVGLQSPSSVSYQLLALERKGFLRKDPNRPRAIEVLSPSTPSDGRCYRQAHTEVMNETGMSDSRPTPAYVPVLGQIAAGVPITAEEVVDDVFALPRQIVGDGELFLLKVVGDSMIDAAICDGDWVVVRP